jgi:hypothetical protein
MARHDDKPKGAPPQHDGGMSPGPAASNVISLARGALGKTWTQPDGLLTLYLRSRHKLLKR